MSAKLIAYYRVSTKQQGQSGLGLEAQEFAVRSYAKAAGAEIVADYTEVESGKRADRPELAKAVAHAPPSSRRAENSPAERPWRSGAFGS